MANNTKKLFIPSTKAEVKELNPWKEGFVTKNESTLYDPNAKWVLKIDEETIDKFNENEDKNSKYKFILSNRPEPFTGNPLKAKVVILTLNPGYVENANKKYAMQLQESGSKDILQAVINHKDEQLRLEAKSFFCPRIKENGEVSYRKANCEFDDKYWYNIFDKLRKELNLAPEGDTEDTIFDNVALVQYVGYASQSWKPIPKKYPLTSQEFTRQLVGYLAFHTKAIIVVSRSYNEWKELLGDEIWKKLKDDNRLVCRKTIVDKNGVCRHIRTQSFSKITFEGDGFNRIAEALAKNK